MKFCIIQGTRPEIIKMSPLIRKYEKDHLDSFMIHTNHHYPYKMDRIFLEELHLPQPRYNLDVGSGSHGKQTDKMLEGIEEKCNWWKNRFGDGRTGERITEVTINFLDHKL